MPYKAHGMSRHHALATTVAGVLLAPVVTWWLIGDLTETRLNPDYIVEPPTLTTAQESVLGIAATVFEFGALLVIVSALRRRLIGLDELQVAAPLLLAGAASGLAFRVVTAGTHGANIGGSMILLVGPPFVLGMLAWSAHRLSVLKRRRANPSR